MSVGVFVGFRVCALAPVAACAAGVAVDHDVLWFQMVGWFQRFACEDILQRTVLVACGTRFPHVCCSIRMGCTLNMKICLRSAIVGDQLALSSDLIGNNHEDVPNISKPTRINLILLE